jgi:hypothetical protein
MGRTIPSFRKASSLQEKEWKSFRNSLGATSLPALSSAGIIVISPELNIGSDIITDRMRVVVHFLIRVRRVKTIRE